uniref:Retroviral polymerase SH3-like domain-containing protein n=1 Tax=Strigamia maritima TaxID=126957 RepID=T1IIK5_STRMM
MNGVAEQINRSIHDGVRTILDKTNLPHGLWAELALTVVYLKNRFPHSTLKNRFPHSTLKNRFPHSTLKNRFPHSTLKNRFPHSTLKNKIPYNLFWNRKFSVKHLKIPGSIAYVHIPAPDRESKHSARAWKGVMLGYGMFTRGYRIWNPDLGKVKETKHVKIIERLNWKNNFNNGEIVGDDLESENGDDQRSNESECYQPMPSSEDDTDVDTSEGEGKPHQMLPTPIKQPVATQQAGASGLKPMQLVDSPLASKVSTRRKKKSPDLVSKRVVSTFEVPNMKG